MSNIDDEIEKTLTRLLADVDDKMEFANTLWKSNEMASRGVKISLNEATQAIKQLITDARVDELEALIEKIECERPDCTTDHSNLRKKYVTNRIKELKENK